MSRQSFTEDNGLRRRSTDFTRLAQDMQKSKETIRSNLLQEVKVVTIPAFTRLYLWDTKSEKIGDTHFVSSGDLNVLVRQGHGPMYRLLQQYAHPENQSNKRNSKDLSQIWDETKEAFKSMPFVRNFVRDDTMEQAISEIVSNFDSEVDAILMAYSNDGKVGIHFVEEGSLPNLALLR